MNLREVINMIDPATASNDWVDLEEIASELGLYGGRFCVESSRISEAWVSKSLCTDTWVGMKAFYLDGEFALLSYQSARKSSVGYHWASPETKAKVFAYLVSLTAAADEDTTSYIDFEADMGEGYKLSYGFELLTDTVILESTGQRVAVVRRPRINAPSSEWSDIDVKMPDGQVATVSLPDDCLVPYGE
ncbi:hypothetical protein A3709_19290 [Halioglobus sp. HI00S01]|uniref:hypothetical protein n=1 Tax=Halioglobus sp. HI00S01 TaxID=1822214 RepID=UPI0007C229A6|nr:hypothetical protein [Halioglobus sp. HI00S01]KZX57769.1 hypothetical protein A3709_19290 [Halioglobus sp. HI00S01]